jgi:DNA primase small subunit
VYEKFSSFYRNTQYSFPPPTSFSQREYAYLLFRERAMVRHKTFATPTALVSALRDRIPSDVYHSCAYYENPDLEMDKKGWIGADLVFDIDADHIPTSCGKIHDEWHCANPDCKVSGGMTGRGVTPEECPACGGVKFEVKTWACEECIDPTRHETRKLLAMLPYDFGFSEHEISHLLFGTGPWQSHSCGSSMWADSEIRNMYAKNGDYVTGVGLYLFDKNRKAPAKEHPKGKQKPRSFGLGDYGWKLRHKLACANS